MVVVVFCWRVVVVVVCWVWFFLPAAVFGEVWVQLQVEVVVFWAWGGEEISWWRV